MSQVGRVIPIFDARQIQAVSDRSGGLRSLPPLTLYIHVPWCVKKCPYCDFNSHEKPPELPLRAYLEALTADLEQALPRIWGRQIHSVFLGGGTPSLLSEAAMDELLSMVRARVSLWADAEVTIEANPGTAEAGRFKSYADSGVNRISLGIQSLDDNQLKSLGRIHDSNQARKAIDLAIDSVKRVNLDLMYGLPGQDADQWRKTLQEIRSFGVEHLSLYQLTLEPQTVFAKYPPPLPDEDVLEEMETVIEQEIIASGWERYEVSAYARAAAMSRHNLNYWTFGDYLGIGPGAHSKISFPDRITREVRTRNPDQWMQRAVAGDGSHLSEQRTIEASDLPFEFMLNALRLKQGVSADMFEAHTGLPLSDIEPQIQRAISQGLLSGTTGRIMATELGWRHLNTLQSMFLEQSHKPARP